ncbi:helix-turn-helix domain-containing protein [Streptomyces sp. GMY02]|uniref:PucR family transcriptional regulator n=1 Tax=Streptomyces sp. GMY02 TaxID=1333528 RepID=UPI001C2BE640|nr:helix-turn-helix domain-containing protein [Streptomyces sp. GMY02]QXE33698.1 helix-turn-helix domain-containing protein [Streptomyces sp. GMY02]
MIDPLFREMIGELPSFAPEVTAVIRAEIPQYSVVPEQEHMRDVRAQLHWLLEGLDQGIMPSPGYLRESSRLGAARAAQGLPIEALLGAYHIGYRETWNAMMRHAVGRGQQAVTELAAQVTLFWAWIRELTNAVAVAYEGVVRSELSAQEDRYRRLIEAMASADPADEATVTLARSLGYDPAGEFQAFRGRSGDLPSGGLESFRRYAATVPGVVVATIHGGAMSVLSQGVQDRVILRSLSRAIRAARTVKQGAGATRLPLGIGLPRAGLPGAADSFQDADGALSLALRQGGGAVRYSVAWLQASLAEQSRRLGDVLGAGARTAAAHPHLAAAVTAYADHGFVPTAAARALNVHPNTVVYRLDRWTTLTGWDPRTRDGLLRSLLALDLCPVAVPAAQMPRP